MLCDTQVLLSCTAQKSTWRNSVIRVALQDFIVIFSELSGTALWHARTELAHNECTISQLVYIVCKYYSHLLP